MYMYMHLYFTILSIRIYFSQIVVQSIMYCMWSGADQFFTNYVHNLEISEILIPNKYALYDIVYLYVCKLYY